ncbi:MAG: hypothetical protein HY329_18450 [Chloroflexi bacterium]|nr:hypothetical protein [Chloroflexota bacterium]
MRLGPVEKRVLSALSELGGGVYLPRLGGYVHRDWQPDGRYVVPPDLTAAERASLRRAVASLERKGLVEGFTMWDGQELGLSEVWLTPDGLDLAESLR